MTYPFKRTAEGDLIIVKLEIDGKYNFNMLLDTGAPCTTIDSNELYINGYHLENKATTAAIETANEIISVDVFEIGSLAAFGITKKHIRIQVYDFFAHGIVSDYDGVLGLDFFEHTQLCINMEENAITVTPISKS
jgi:hypothetical protein